MRSKGQEREQNWRRLIVEQEASGEGVREFCQRRRISVNGFYEWRRRLGEAAEPARFALVETNATATAGGGWEIELAGGDKIRVAAGADLGRLAAVVAALRGGR